MTTEILTPDYKHIFHVMIEEARRQAGGSMISEQQAVALRAVQRWFAPLAVAVNAATSVAEIEQLRSLMTDISGLIDKTAFRLENSDEG